MPSPWNMQAWMTLLLGSADCWVLYVLKAFPLCFSDAVDLIQPFNVANGKEWWLDLHSSACGNGVPCIKTSAVLMLFLRFRLFLFLSLLACELRSSICTWIMDVAKLMTIVGWYFSLFLLFTYFIVLFMFNYVGCTCHSLGSDKEVQRHDCHLW